MNNFRVNGIVAHRDKLPYIQLSTENGIICQLSMAEAFRDFRAELDAEKVETSNVDPDK